MSSIHDEVFPRSLSRIGVPRLPGSFALVAVLVAAVLSFNFGGRLLLTNDDTRFPVLARDVLVNGHWLLPALPDGRPHLMKPPLVVWQIAVASLPAGAVSVRTAVLPSLLEAIGVALLTCWLGRRLFAAEAGVVAGLCVATMVEIYSMAHSSMPDMAQLAAGTGAIAAYARFEFEYEPAWLTPLYALIGLGSLAKGAAGFIPLAVVLVDTIATHGIAGVRRLVSLPGWILLAVLALPWWVLAAVTGRREGFVHGVVVNDQLLSYFWRPAWNWRTMTEPLVHAVTAMLPWVVLVPLAVRRALREVHPETRRRLRLLFCWLLTALILLAASGRQRERYYLPLCPACALLIGWWYSTTPSSWRARAFATAWAAVVICGAVLVMKETPRFNATTDVSAVQAIVARAPAPLFSFDLQDLALSFNLDRPVVNDKNYGRFEARARQGRTGYLIISDRALERIVVDPCMRRVARGRVTGRAFAVLDSRGCSARGEQHEMSGTAALTRGSPF